MYQATMFAIKTSFFDINNTPSCGTKIIRFSSSSRKKDLFCSKGQSVTPWGCIIGHLSRYRIVNHLLLPPPIHYLYIYLLPLRGTSTVLGKHARLPWRSCVNWHEPTCLRRTNCIYFYHGELSSLVFIHYFLYEKPIERQFQLYRERFFFCRPTGMLPLHNVTTQQI